MASTATLTGKTGTGNTLTAGVFNNVTTFEFQLVGATPGVNKSVIRVVSDTGISYVDFAADTTVTATLSAGNLAITVS